MKKRFFLSTLATAVLFTGPVGAQTVNVFATTSLALSGQTYTAAELGGFDPTGASKLVVTISDEGARPSAVTYAGQSLIRAVATSGRTADIWYLDYDGITATQGDLVLNTGGSSQGVSLIAMQNTAKGFVAVGSGGTNSASLDPSHAGSAVVAAYVGNGVGTATANAPLTTVLSAPDIGSAYGGSGVGIVSAGSQTFSFSNTGSPGGTTAAAFAAVGADGSAPEITSVSPADESTDLLTNQTITVNFNEAIYPGSGEILIKEDGGATFASFDVTSSPSVSLSTTSLSISYTFEPDTSYFLQIPSGAVEDGSGNTTSYADTTLNFSTGPWLTFGGTGKSTYTPADHGNFDPTGYDKIVAIVMDEGGSFPSGITWGSSAMSLVANASSGRRTSMFYLDGPFTGPKTLTVSGIGSSFGISLLALSGTAEGVGAFDTITGTGTINFTTSTADSFVVAGYTANGGGNTPNAAAPLERYFGANVGSADGASAVAINTTLGTQTFSFTGNTSSPSLVIAEFGKVGADSTAPVVTGTSPVDESTGILTDTTLTVSFNESIVAGSGSILLKKDGGATVGTYDVTSAPELSFGASDFTITPDVLEPGTSYFLQIPSGAIEDGGGNTTAYADTTLNFTTEQFLTLRTAGNGTFTAADLRNFDPSGYDKVVVTLMDEGSVASSVTYAGSAMNLVASNVNVIRVTQMFYLDGPFSGPGSLSISGGSSFGIGLLALSGTVPGVATFATTDATSIDFTTTTDDAFVVAAFTSNNESATAAAPLTQYFSANVGSSAGASGAYAATDAGTEAYSFVGSSSPSLVIAEFATTSTGGGGGDPFDDWATLCGLTGGNNGFADNPSGGPFDNGLLWILGSTTPLDYNSYDSLVTATGDGTTGITLVFDRVDESIGETDLNIGYSTDAFENDNNVVGPIPASGSSVDIGDGVLVTIVDNGATDTITVVIPAGLASGGSLYVRLLATEL